MGDSTSRLRVDTQLTVDGGSRIDGQGLITGGFNSTLVNQGRIRVEPATTMTIETHLLENDGLLQAQSGATMVIAAEVVGNGIVETNSGIVRKLSMQSDLTVDGPAYLARNGGTLEFAYLSRTPAREVRVQAGGQLLVDPGGSHHDFATVLAVKERLIYALTEEADWDWNPQAELRLVGGTQPERWARLEIAGTDLGMVSNGFSDNFELPKLVVGDGAEVLLLDILNNGNRGVSSEALYVDVLEFSDPSGLINLNGLNLYYNTLVGDPAQIVDQPIAATGDFDGDELFALFDIDALVAAVAEGYQNPMFDLNSDSLVNLADLDVWLAEAGAAQLASGNPYLYGDSNLDGLVDELDFIDWNGSKFTATAAWSQGDFNADGVVDGQDFIIWNGNKFTSSDGLTAIPEPGTVVLALVAMLLLLAARTHR